MFMKQTIIAFLQNLTKPDNQLVVYKFEPQIKKSSNET